MKYMDADSRDLEEWAGVTPLNGSNAATSPAADQDQYSSLAAEATDGRESGDLRTPRRALVASMNQTRKERDIYKLCPRECHAVIQ